MYEPPPAYSASLGDSSATVEYTGNKEHLKFYETRSEQLFYVFIISL